MFDIGLQELILIFVIALLVFGPKNLPQLGRSLGRAMREFKKASAEFESTIRTNLQIDEIDSPPQPRTPPPSRSPRPRPPPPPPRPSPRSRSLQRPRGSPPKLLPGRPSWPSEGASSSILGSAAGCGGSASPSACTSSESPRRRRRPSSP